MQLRKNKLILLLCVLFIILQLPSFYSSPWWDSSVYIGMGKYMFSSGTIGFNEPARPPIWPFILGIIWKLTSAPFFYGKILVLLFSLGSIYLTYRIAQKIFDNAIARLTTVLLLCSPTFFMYSSVVQTEIPALFFFLFSTYLLLKNNTKLAGLTFGITFLIRFFTLIPIIGIVLSLIQTKKKLYQLLYFLVLPLLVYFGSAAFYFGNPFYPFILQSTLTQTTGLMFHQPLTYYLKGLLLESVFLVFEYCEHDLGGMFG